MSRVAQLPAQVVCNTLSCHGTTFTCGGDALLAPASSASGAGDDDDCNCNCDYVSDRAVDGGARLLTAAEVNKMLIACSHFVVDCAFGQLEFGLWCSIYRRPTRLLALRVITFHRPTRSGHYSGDDNSFCNRRHQPGN